MWSYKNQLRMKWDLCIIVLALYNCITIPLDVAFPSEQEQAVIHHTETNGVDGTAIFERIVDCLFAVDIAMSFRTTYVNPLTNTEVMDGKRIAGNYFFSSRFWIDLMASIPFEMFYSVDDPIDGVEAPKE